MSNPTGKGGFTAGKSGNPKGRPKGSRDKLTTEFIDWLLVAFEKRGLAAIYTLAEKNPLDFLKLVAQLTPKALHVKGDHTVTHLTEAVSETAAWIEQTLAEETDRKRKKPLPN